MARDWTFAQKVGAGFALIASLAIVVSVAATYALRTVVERKDLVLTSYAQFLIEAERVLAESNDIAATARGYLIVPEERFLERMREARSNFTATLERLTRGVPSGEERQPLDVIVSRSVAYNEAIDRVLEMRRGGSPLDAVARAFEEQAAPKRDDLRSEIQAFVSRQKSLLDEAMEASTRIASNAIRMVVATAAGTALLAALLAFLLTRSLGSQIGTAVGQVQSSSTELQAAANQQATGAREQATAMSEITTTTSELLATSRQIAESAQRVAQIAEQTASAARSGDGTVERTNEAVMGIRRQVEFIVSHMLELGKKSQQIGAVLDIVAELAEQTNILAINATIEAAGAGESGKRFAVVAEEIRKLADRVGVSTKEIRGLIDDVRSAVNATVMATETGSKAVEGGARQFSEVTLAFRQIAQLVSTTTEAAKEIELSTKQQTSAVEQVNVAITNVAQASRENEASTGQTLQTAAQLSGLARELLRVVQPQSSSLQLRPDRSDRAA
jgi:methyl-accepting chemotaxis protein